MRIFIACNHIRFLQPRNSTYRDIIKKIKNCSKHEIKFVYTNESETNIKNIFNSFKPDIFILFTVTNFMNPKKFLFALKKYNYVLSMDLFYYTRFIKMPYNNKFDGIFTYATSTKLLNTYKNKYPNKYIDSLNGRFINTHIYKNYNLPKKYDILIYGTRYFINKIENHQADIEYKKKWEEHHGKKLPCEYNFYPLRHKIETLLKNNSHKYNLMILPQICSIESKKYVNSDLSKLINQAHITLATCSRVDILMDKYIEIAGSYSAILGNIPTDHRDVFNNNIIEVTEWMSDEEILNKIDNALSDKKKLWNMTKKLGDEIHLNFNLDKMCSNMDKIFDNIEKRINK